MKNRIIALMEQAGERVIEGQRKAAVSAKGRANFVTDTDLAVQEFFRAALKEAFPKDGFYSEEQENETDFSRPLWILDPIDGTANYITGYCQSAISLARMEQGRIVFGAVYNPFTRELFTAERGGGAFCNGCPIHADHATEMPDAIIDLGTMPYYKERAGEVGAMCCEILLRASDIRRIGSAALALCYAAAGRTAAMIEGRLQLWDYAAGALIAEEAGAIVCNWDEKELSFRGPQSVLAAGRAVYPEVIKMIREVTKK